MARIIVLLWLQREGLQRKAQKDTNIVNVTNVRNLKCT